MRSRIAAAICVGVLALVPASAAAQEQQPPNRLPTDQQQVAPEDKPEAVGACGAVDTAIVDRGTTVGTTAPPDEMNKNGQMPVGLSAVRGTLVHSEGNLLLIRQPEPLSVGNTAPGGGARPSLLAVVRLPAECAPGMLTEGEGVTAVGMATPEGILNAQTVQPGE